MQSIAIADPHVTSSEERAVLKVLRSGSLTRGERTRELEQVFHRLSGTKEAVAVSSGTAGLHAVLMALRITKGDEVIISPFTFIASASSILQMGAKVVFADIDPRTFLIDPDAVARRITGRTRVIIGIDLFGQKCRYEQIQRSISGKKIALVEDSCQAIGTRRNGKSSGQFGAAAVFSFNATKILYAGEGGMIVTNSVRLANRLRSVRNNGIRSGDKRLLARDLGFNYHLPEIQAALVVTQVKQLKRMIGKRRANAAYLTKGLKRISGIQPPVVDEGNTHVFNYYTIRVTRAFATDRNVLIRYLNQRGVGARVYYPRPLHLHPLFQGLGYGWGDFPVSERASQEVLSLPVHPGLTRKALRMIVDAMEEAG